MLIKVSKVTIISSKQNFKAKVLNFAVFSFGHRILSFSFNFFTFPTVIYNQGIGVGAGVTTPESGV